MDQTRFLGIGFAVALALATSTAGASGPYTAVIQQTLGLAKAPECTLCHAGVGTVGNVKTPFGQTAVARGLVAFSPDKLKEVLASMAADDVDSDSDGVGDIQELENGTDPNIPDAPDAGVVEPISYGCSLARNADAPNTTSHDAWLAGALVGVGMMLTRRRRPDDG